MKLANVNFVVVFVCVGGGGGCTKSINLYYSVFLTL